MIVTASGPDLVEILETTSELASAEKPRPPYSFGMLRPKNLFFLMKSQVSGLRSPFLYTSQSGLIYRVLQLGHLGIRALRQISFCKALLPILCKIRFTGKKFLFNPCRTSFQCDHFSFRDSRKNVHFLQRRN